MKAKHPWPQSQEEKRVVDDVFKQTLQALDRFNQHMLEAGYKVRKGLASGSSGQINDKALSKRQRIKKAA